MYISNTFHIQVPTTVHHTVLLSTRAWRTYQNSEHSRSNVSRRLVARFACVSEQLVVQDGPRHEVAVALRRVVDDGGDGLPVAHPTEEHVRVAMLEGRAASVEEALAHGHALALVDRHRIRAHERDLAALHVDRGVSQQLDLERAS